MITKVIVSLMAFAAVQCGNKVAKQAQVDPETVKTAVTHFAETEPEKRAATPVEVVIEKELTYDQHTLADEYPYKNGTRRFQWDKIKDSLSVLEMAHRLEGVQWGTLQNYKDKNGVAPEVQDPEINEYHSAVDEFGVNRYQSVPLYKYIGEEKPERYGRDGALMLVLADTAGYVKVGSLAYQGVWYVPEKYIKVLDTKQFGRVIFADKENQNITTLEKSGDKWLVRSMNPATTGLHNPPYQMETPEGVFVIQEHKPKMFYTVDGTSQIAGYAPHASRFTRGGYIHGVPLNNPNATKLTEFSSTLGTTPRSHLCIRNATSHAEFIYNWAAPLESLVYVI